MNDSRTKHSPLLNGLTKTSLAGIMLVNMSRDKSETKPERYDTKLNKMVTNQAKK